MSTVFCPTCGDDVDPRHSGCGRADCPYRDPELPIEHVPGHHDVVEEKEEEKPKVKSKKEMLDDLNEYGRKVDAGENPPNKPPLPWKKH